VKEFELYLPLSYNDGSPIELAKITRIAERLHEQFGGLTFFPQPNKGLWRMGPVTFHDEIVIYRVLTDDVPMARSFFRALKDELKQELRQEQILIVEREVGVV
jgi:hypothetical protein